MKRSKTLRGSNQGVSCSQLDQGAGGNVPPKATKTRQVSPQEKSMAMVLIGWLKRSVVDNQARRFGNKRHTGTFPYLENIKAKALVPLKR